MAEERAFKYKGVSAKGGEVSDLVMAPDRREALRKLARDGVVVTEITESAPSGSGPSLLPQQRAITPGVRILILRQLALMARAGVDLLESLETAATGLGGEAAARLREVASGLRRGDQLGKAFQDGMPGFPSYVYTLISVGEASGKLDSVLEDAASQLAFEDRVRRDLTSALTYPSFLLVAGAGAVGFLFYEVVPRFAEMIGDNRQSLTGLAAFVIGAGETFRGNAVLILSALVVLGVAAAASLSSPQGRRQVYDVARTLPVLKELLIARERATWARIMGFALGSGVGLLEAADLAALSAPEGRFRRGLQNATRAIRAGKRVDEAFSEPNLLTNLDLSLLRAGQRSGALNAMFRFIAERYEDDLRDALKRVTALIEPVAIGFVALAVGAVAIGLVTAMSSVYETVQ